MESLLQKTTASNRLQSVDVLRGAVMVLMAIDHVRVYSGQPAGGPTPGIFFTRWVTHFCAPAFAFFAGVSVFFYGRKINDRKKLSQFLFTRGLLLVFLELTLIRYFWTFNLNFSEFILAGVIWMLGWCMVLLSGMVWMRASTVGIIGLAIIFFQQIFHFVPNIFPESMRATVGKIWEFFYPSGLKGPNGIAILYVLIPWIGVMAAGYGFGTILRFQTEKRRRTCLWIGLGATILYLIIGSIIIIRNPSNDTPFIFRLLNQGKYPPTQLFLMMTLGPVIALIPFAEKAKGWLVQTLSYFGKVPMFYYLMHIPLIHLSALFVNLITKGDMHQEWYNTAPFTNVPQDQQWSLGLLYLVYFIDLVILYFACRWYATYKYSQTQTRWLKYI